MFAPPEQRRYINSRLKATTSGYTSAHQMPQLDAVIIRNLTYEIGKGRNKRVILNKIDMTVPEGSIYGLLGPSGCGKTTMLRCVVGRIRPRSGSILVFGFQPATGYGEVPGRDVGYMPQEISIYEDFTIEETLQYFGRINRMRASAIRKRIEFLVQFLDLPKKSRSVANLSGGQKRRVSLAAALIHSPPLLILDEPTVGVDPLLRQSIWQHLVSLTQTERISVIITTHYIEEARQANVVGLMRNGKILAEDSPDDLMRYHELNNLEDVFLKLCVTDTSRRAALLATGGANDTTKHLSNLKKTNQVIVPTTKYAISSEAKKNDRQTETSEFSDSTSSQRGSLQRIKIENGKATIKIHTGTNRIELNDGAYTNEAIEVFSSEDEDDDEDSDTTNRPSPTNINDINFRELIVNAAGTKGETSRLGTGKKSNIAHQYNSGPQLDYSITDSIQSDDYLAVQAIKWNARRTNALNMANLKLSRNRNGGIDGRRKPSKDPFENGNSFYQWWKTLIAVTWKNYIRLRRNPPVLVFQFMLPALQVILFCLCIGGEPFDVPVAIVNDEVVPKSSLQFLNGLNKKVIRQIKYDNLSSAIEAVRRGNVWGAIHIPDKYSENLQSRLIMGEEVTNDTIKNGTIKVYPDFTNLHLALALENTFRETFINFARNSLEEIGYDKSLASSPIEIGDPVYGTLRRDGYLEFMAPGVVISIIYVMATGLTSLAFILERRDGLLERSLVSGVQTSQILLAHAINQVVVMVLQVFLVLGCTFFIFEIPSRGPLFWVVLLILLQGCTGMAYGLLVSAICAEENTAVMMVVGTFYTNLILAGIIWPLEAMPHWLRPLSYAQPQTLPTDTLRHILSRGWGIMDKGVLLGFAVTVGWLVIFLLAAGAIFKYSR